MKITLEDLRKAMKLIDLQRETKKLYFPDCWVEVDAITKEPIRIGLTKQGKKWIEELFNFRPKIKGGVVTTLYGIPIVKSTEEDLK